MIRALASLRGGRSARDRRSRPRARPSASIRGRPRAGRPRGDPRGPVRRDAVHVRRASCVVLASLPTPDLGGAVRPRARGGAGCRSARSSPARPGAIPEVSAGSGASLFSPGDWLGLGAPARGRPARPAARRESRVIRRTSSPATRPGGCRAGSRPRTTRGPDGGQRAVASEDASLTPGRPRARGTSLLSTFWRVARATATMWKGNVGSTAERAGIRARSSSRTTSSVSNTWWWTVRFSTCVARSLLELLSGQPLGDALAGRTAP